MNGPGDNLAPLLAEALAMLPPPHRAAVEAAIGVAPVTAAEARAQRLEARDAALVTAAALMPAATATATARALAVALSRFAAAGYVPGDRPGDGLRAALHDALALNGGEPLGRQQLRKILVGEGRA